MPNVVIFGIGRGADVATRYFRTDTPYEVAAYTVDDEYADRPEFMDRPVIPFSRIQDEIPPAETEMFVALGYQRMNELRAEKCADARAKGYTLASYVSSRIVTPDPPRFGDNCLILDGNVFDHDVTVGNNVVMWSANHLGDLAVIEDDVWLSSHVVLSGEVTIGTGSFVAVNATIANNVRIGARSYIGPNALITRDTNEGAVHLVDATPRVEGVDSSRILRLLHR